MSLDPNALNNLPANAAPVANAPASSAPDTSVNTQAPAPATAPTSAPAPTAQPAPSSSPTTTLAQIISYSKANPQSDYAKRAAELIQTGQFDAQAQKEGVDLSWAGRPPLQKPTDTTTPASGGGNSIIDALTKSEQGAGKTIGDAIYAPEAGKIAADAQTSHADLLQKMIDESAQLKAQGKDTSSIDHMIGVFQKEAATNNVAGGDVSKIIPSVDKTPEQVLGEFGGVAADLIGAGGGLSAAGYGASAMAAGAAQDNKSATGVVSDALVGALVGKIAEVGFKAVAPTLQAALAKYGAPLYDKLESSIPETLRGPMKAIADGADAVVSKVNEVTGSKTAPVVEKAATETAPIDQKALNKSITDTSPLQDKNTRINELRNAKPNSTTGKGGVARTGILGKSTPQATAHDIEVATEAHPYISNTKDPLTKIQNVNQGITDKSGQLDSFLNENPTKANFEDMRAYMETNKPSPILQKDPGANEAYGHATDNAVNTLYNTLKESATKSGDFGPNLSGADIRQARIAIDQQIQKELGETTFDSPQYKGIKAAEVDTRNLINRMNEDMLRYPGQLDKVNQMNDFISNAKGRGINVDMTNPRTQAQLEDSFGLTKTPESEANAQKLADQHKSMSNLYEARDNMIDKYQSNVGKSTKVSEWIKANPIKAKAIGWGAGLLGAGEVYKHLQ